MALLPAGSLNEYKVTLKSGEDVWTDYVLAPDSEHAAWQALELSINRHVHLVDVILADEW